MSDLGEPAELLEKRPELLDDGLQGFIDAYVSLRRTADAVHRHVEAELNGYGVTGPVYGILLNLATKGPMSLTDLGESIFRSNSTITALIDRLEADGLVTREDHARDRRVTMAKLTDQGEKLFHQIRAPHRRFLADMMSCLSKEELSQLLTLLEKVRTKVEEERCP